MGSGHFLVSALNELIVIKHDLKILQDQEGKTIRDYNIEIVNDELMITDDNNIPFSYNPNNSESQRIQETLFKEKETLIENCLFGVDINPNSVKICRLRLWIELLKNAFYKENNELETLPNIDINIKCGNSLISRFDLTTDLKKALKQSKWNIESYKLAVATYRNAENKEQKREMERLIEDIKGNFRSEIAINDPKKLTLEKKKGELFNYTQQVGMFELGKKEQTEFNKRVNKLADEVKTLETQLEEIKSNKIYENAFEWRFEFPEVLNDNGDFVGFDVVIGNPPYVDNRGYDKNILNFYFEKYSNSFSKSGTDGSKTTKLNLISPFFEISISVLKTNGYNNLIFHKNILKTNAYSNIRKFILEHTKINSLVDWGAGQFEDVIAETASMLLEKSINSNDKIKIEFYSKESLKKITTQKQDDFYLNYDYIFNIAMTIKDKVLIEKFENIKNISKLSEFVYINNGIVTGNDKKYLSNKILNENYKPAIRGREIKKFYSPKSNSYINYLKEELLRARNEVIFTSDEKLLMQMINTEFIVSYDDDKTYNLGTTYAITSKSELNLKYILSLLNSKLYNFYYQKKFINESSLTNAISTKNLYELPINNIPKKQQQPFIDKVDQILALKKTNPEVDTTALEKEIDKMVYALYGLSDEEIAIVEGS